MGKSFVFRDENGRLCGYLMQRDGQLRCRIYSTVKDAKLSVVSETGEMRTYELPGVGSESAWHDSLTEIAAAYVTQGDALLMDTGPAARQKHAAALADRKRKNEHLARSAQAPEQLQDKTDGQKAERQNPQSMKEERTDPQRRWPPPILMQHPVYRDGRWLDEMME